MAFEQLFEPVALHQLLERVQALKAEGHRLVQISGTRMEDQVELTYSFDRNGHLLSLRLHQVPGAAIPSITRIYWSAFLYENELHDLFGVNVEGIAVDFHGKLYQTAVKFPFGWTKAPDSSESPTAPVRASNGAPTTPPLTGANHG